MYKGNPIRLSADSSAETLQAKREWNGIFKVLKGKTSNLEFSTQQGYHSELKERLSFPGKQKLEEFITTKLAP